MMLRGTPLALLALCAPLPALAQNCPVDNNDRDPTRPLMPSIVSYSIDGSRPVTDPNEIRVRGTDPHDTTVVGGDLEDRLRIEVTLSEPFPASCPMPLTIVDTNVPLAQRNAGQQGMVANLTDDRLMREAGGRIDGSTRIQWEVPTKAVASPRTFRTLALQMGNTSPTYPIVITLNPLPAPTVTALDASASFGELVEIRAETPIVFEPGAATEDRRVTFRVTPASAGSFVNAPSTSPDRFFTGYNLDVQPSRATAFFQPAMTSTPVQAQIVTEYRGGSVSRPVTVTPWRCDPQVDFSIVSGGIEVEVANAGSATCPRLEARLLSSSQILPALAPTPNFAKVPVNKTAGVVRPLSIASSTASRTGSWSGRYTVPAVYQRAGGFTLMLTLRPVDGRQAISFPLEVSAAGAAAMRAPPPR